MSGGSPGILDQGAIESTLHKARNLFYYSDRQVTIFELAAAYGYGVLNLESAKPIIVARKHF
ncbi:MAG: hypothetical protein HC916_20535 [Coleofasciculaceae cyanobacterium SM2_1_6]|nr:hypothetical protein [Coleofasciculaceae cyanobacterium SM2_1_6]